MRRVCELGLGLCLWTLVFDRGLCEDQMSFACPESVPIRSVGVCERCLSNEMCQKVGNFTYRCDPYQKKCVHPDWNGVEVAKQCQEDPNDISTWGARCERLCPDDRAPFTCAHQACLNEDFPCKWLSQCSPPRGMKTTMAVCTRACANHDDLLSARDWETGDHGDNKQMTRVRTCEEGMQEFTCKGQNPKMSEFCPVSCPSSNECRMRCERDEIRGWNGLTCYDYVHRDGYTCEDAIRIGMDCHCTCGNVYGAKERYGPFDIFDKHPITKEKLIFEREVISGNVFTLDVTGKGLSEDAQGRIKIIGHDDHCGTSNLAKGVSGIECEQPPGASVDEGYFCKTKPGLNTIFQHRWTEVSIGACGTFRLCHCNTNCGESTNWRNLGSIVSKPPARSANEIGVERGLPGCSDFWIEETTTPSSAEYERAVMHEKPVAVETTLAFYGGLDGTQDEVLRAIKLALATYLQFYDALLDKVVPVEEDVTIRRLRRRLRLQGGTTSSIPLRRLQATTATTTATLTTTAMTTTTVATPTTAMATTTNATTITTTTETLSTTLAADGGTVATTDTTMVPSTSATTQGPTTKGLSWQEKLERDRTSTKAYIEETTTTRFRNVTTSTTTKQTTRGTTTQYIPTGPCEDNDAAFAEETDKLGIGHLKTCKEAKEVFVTLCEEGSMQNAIMIGCRKMCDKCKMPESTTTLDASMPAEGSSVNLEERLASMGEPLTVSVEIRTLTDVTTDTVVQRLQNISQDEGNKRFSYLFLKELTRVVADEEIPDKLYVHLVQAPVARNNDSKEEEGGTDDALIIGLACGGGILVLCCCCGIGYYCLNQQEEEEEEEEPAVQDEPVEQSYRKKKVAESEPTKKKKKKKKSILHKLPCCRRRLEKLDGEEASSDPPYVGAQVRLKGLSKREYNGLNGTILSGPNEKGRWVVDVIIFEDATTEEHKEMSFKSENLQVQSAKKEVRAAGGSYRTRVQPISELPQ